MECTIYWASIPKLMEEATNLRAFNLLSSMDRANIDKIKAPRAKYASLLGRELLLEGLLNANKDIRCLSRLSFDVFNRPIIDCGLSFSIAHSFNIAVCALSEYRIGIDIEKKARLNFREFSIRFLENELEAIFHSDNPTDSFYELWTKKEAATKADGRGYRLEPNQIELQNNRAIVDNKTWRLKKIDLLEGYSCHLASEFEITEINIKQVAF